MEILPLLCIVSVAFTGLTKGAIVTIDGPLNAAVGEKVTFTPTLPPPEKPFISVAWTFGDKNIITSNVENITGPEYEGRITFFTSTAALELRDLTLTDSGEYRVTIIRLGEAQMEGKTRLTIYEPASKVRATASSTDLVELSGSVRLSCSSSGSSLSFLWMNSSSEVTASDRVQLTDGNSTLTVVNVSRYDQGPFRCHVSNPVSNGTSDPVNLFISYGPENINLTISPSQEYFGEGSNISLICSADSRPLALIFWFLNGNLLSDTGPELKLMNINQGHSGNYSCQAFNNRNMRNETSQPSAVIVLEKISGVSVTSSTNLPIEGNSVNLTCEAAGSISTTMWMKDGSDLILVDNMIFLSDHRVLSFTPLNKTDSGEYYCNISNPVSSDGAKYNMVVNYGPDNVQITGPAEMHVGQTLKLTCSAESTPAAVYNWTLNGKEIHFSSVFTKGNAEVSDSGNYTCEAMNNVTGRTSRSTVHRLSVTAIPEAPSCSDVCIAIAVIGSLAGCVAIVVGGCCIHKRKKQPKKSLDENTPDGFRGEGQQNTAYSRDEELNYADISFQTNHGRTVQVELKNNSMPYAQIRTNNGPPAVAPPPSYDAYMQQKKKADRRPDANSAPLYNEVCNN